MRVLLTAQESAMTLALREAGLPRVLKTLEPGVALCERTLSRFETHPIFLRHIQPAQAVAALSGAYQDIAKIEAAARELLPLLDANKTFSVQTRILGEWKPDYMRFDVNEALARALIGEGFRLDVKAPAQAVSVAIAEARAYVGVSEIADNLSNWAGGCRRFKREEDQISRAEFKLLEALEVFSIKPPEGGHALDLGAAPGGWTRVLRQRGLTVTAVDPAPLDPRVANDTGVRHLRATAQQVFQNPPPCDLMVNDMKMDSLLSAELMAQGSNCLCRGGHAILTLKLSEQPLGWPRRVARAVSALTARYAILGVRQLFHNRSEVTVALRRI